MRAVVVRLRGSCIELRKVREEEYLVAVELVAAEVQLFPPQGFLVPQSLPLQGCFLVLLKYWFRKRGLK